MTDDELQAMVRDELFWDPRVDRDAIAVSENDGEVTLWARQRPKRPGAGVEASPGSASPDQRQGAAMRSPLPPIADYGFLSDCLTDALVAPGTCPNMTIIVSDGKTPVATGAKQWSHWLRISRTWKLDSMPIVNASLMKWTDTKTER
jgi:hypothetical protein